MVECTILIYKGQQSRVDNEGQTNIIVISSEVDPAITRSDQISDSSFRLFKDPFFVVSVSLVFFFAALDLIRTRPAGDICDFD
ncbi:hypothetical protein GQ457_04G034030 [Hibiscus cannabinus]